MRLIAALMAGAFAASAAPVTHLFLNWYGVDAGVAVFRVNRSQVDPKNLEVLDQVKDYYKIKFADGDTPPEMENVPTGVRIRAEQATKSEPWLKPEKPWELGGVALQRVIQEDGKYRVWYSCSVGGHDAVHVLPNGRKKLKSDGERFGGLCYMESTDAAHWVRPSLGIVEFRGSKDNNIVTTDPRVGPAIFIDRAAPPAERYKSVANTSIQEFYKDSKTVGPLLSGAVSPDGIHWTPLSEPLWKEVFNNDGSPEAHRDSATGKYVLFMRANYPRRRSISRAETSDFRNWPHPTIILTPGPDEEPTVDFYDNPYFEVPGVTAAHLLLVSSYHRDTSVVDIRMASSMDGDGWNWLSPRSVVPLGKPGEWDSGMLWLMSDMVRLPDGRFAVGLWGNNSRHEEYWRVKFERGKERTEWTAWAIWEDGRLAGIEAEKAGEFTTLPLRVTGRPIEINARTGYSGSVQVDLLMDGEPRKATLRAKEMTGDIRWKTLEWTGGDLAALEGKAVRLRFHLYDAKVFGVRGEGLEFVSSYKRK